MSDNGTFVAEVRDVPGGEAINECIQCGTCTGSCPNAKYMDYAPRKVIYMIKAGMKEEVLSCNTMWYCATCYLCTARCPRDVKPTGIMNALASLSVRHKLANKKTLTPIFYKAFVDVIRNNGRAHEGGMMMKAYMRIFWKKLKSNPIKAFGMISLVKMLPFAFSLLKRGRMPLKAKKIKDRDGFKAIIAKAQSLGGA